LVTTTLTVPRAWEDVRTRIDVLPSDSTVAFDPPKVTTAPETKFVPEMVTIVPPEREPLVGETLLMVGPGVV
jgi:hypothetical protein